MFRAILPVVAGMIVAFLAIGLVELMSVFAVPPPPGIMSQDPAIKRDALSRLPTESRLFELVAYGLGSFLGGYTAAYTSRQNQMGNAIIVGAILFLAGLMNLMQVPSPAWFAISSLLIFFPCAYAGARVGEHI